MKTKILFLAVFAVITVLLTGCGSNNTEQMSESKQQNGNTGTTENKNASVNPAEEKTKTVKNLKDAFKGETTASEKYAAYSKKAKEEGFLKIALLFEAASNSEKIHANNHLAALEQLGEKPDEFKPEYDVKSTKENLEDAIKGESYETSTMYPEFIKTANNGNVNIALITFNYAYKTEQKHKVMYENALNALNAGGDTGLPPKYYVCSTCGNTYDAQAPKRCGISMTSSDKFLTIE